MPMAMTKKERRRHQKEVKESKMKPAPPRPPPPPPPAYHDVMITQQWRPGKHPDEVPDDYIAHEAVAKMAPDILVQLDKNAVEIGMFLKTNNKNVTFGNILSPQTMSKRSSNQVSFNVYLMHENNVLKEIPDERTKVYKFVVHVLDRDQRVGDILQQLRFQNGIIAKSVRHLDGEDGNIMQDRLVLARNYKHLNMAINYSVDENHLTPKLRKIFI